MEFEPDYMVADIHPGESLSSKSCSVYCIYDQGSGSCEHYLKIQYLTFLVVVRLLTFEICFCREHNIRNMSSLLHLLVVCKMCLLLCSHFQKVSWGLFNKSNLKLRSKRESGRGGGLRSGGDAFVIEMIPTGRGGSYVK